MALNKFGLVGTSNRCVANRPKRRRYVSVMAKRPYLLIQILILIAPAATTAYLAETGSAAATLQLLFTCSVGFIFLVPLGMFAEGPLTSFLGETGAFAVACGTYFGFAGFVLTRLYASNPKRIITVSVANLWLSLWSVFVGQAFMSAVRAA